MNILIFFINLNILKFITKVKFTHLNLELDLFDPWQATSSGRATQVSQVELRQFPH